MSLTAVRATLIPADHICRTSDGKWCVVGIYNYAHTVSDELSVTLKIYIRIQFDRLGRWKCRLQLSDRSVAPHIPPPFEVAFEACMDNADQRIFETAIELPQLRVPAPIPMAQRPPGSASKVAFLIGLLCEEEPVASVAFDAIFLAPPAQARIL